MAKRLSLTVKHNNSPVTQLKGDVSSQETKCCSFEKNTDGTIKLKLEFTFHGTNSLVDTADKKIIGDTWNIPVDIQNPNAISMRLINHTIATTNELSNSILTLMFAVGDKAGGGFD